MQPQLVMQGVNIVLRGQFNPAIFQPAWFASRNLIREQEAEASKILIIHPEATEFDVEWLQVRVRRDRFQVSSTQEAYYEALRDIVVGMFTILDQTPLKGMGINRSFHYKLESEKSWHAVGDRLAPKQDWNGILNKPGMRSLNMEGKRPDDYVGYVLVKVEPSTQTSFGVFVEVNDHYELESSSYELNTTDNAISILSENWQSSMKYSLDIATKIADLGSVNE